MNNLLTLGSRPKSRAWVFLPFAEMLQATRKLCPDGSDRIFLHMVPQSPLNYSWCDSDAIFVSLIVCNREYLLARSWSTLCHKFVSNDPNPCRALHNTQIACTAESQPKENLTSALALFISERLPKESTKADTGVSSASISAPAVSSPVACTASPTQQGGSLPFIPTPPLAPPAAASAVTHPLREQRLTTPSPAAPAQMLDSPDSSAVNSPAPTATMCAESPSPQPQVAPQPHRAEATPPPPPALLAPAPAEIATAPPAPVAEPSVPCSAADAVPELRFAAMRRAPLDPVSAMSLPQLLRELSSLTYARTPPYVPHPQEEGGPIPPDLGLQAMTKAMSLAVREGSTHAVAQRAPHRAPHLVHAVFADGTTAANPEQCMGPVSRTYPQAGGTVTHLSDAGVPVATPVPGFGTACQPGLVDTAAMRGCAGLVAGQLEPDMPAPTGGTTHGPPLENVLFCDAEGETDPRVALPAFLVAHDDDGACDDPREHGQAGPPASPQPCGADASVFLVGPDSPPLHCVPSRMHASDPHAALTPWASVDRVNAIIRRVAALTQDSCGRVYPLNPPPPPFVLLSPDSTVDVGQWPVPHRSTDDHRRTLRGLEPGLAAMSAARKTEELHMRQVTGAVAVKVRRPGMTYQYMQEGSGRTLAYSEYEELYMADVERVRGDGGRCVVTRVAAEPPAVDSWWAQPQGPVKFAPAVALLPASPPPATPAPCTQPPPPQAADGGAAPGATSPLPTDAAAVDDQLVEVAVDALVAALQEAGGALAPLSHPVPADTLAAGASQLVRAYLLAARGGGESADTPHPALPPSPASASSAGSPGDEMTPLAPPSPVPTPPSVKRVVRSASPNSTPQRQTHSSSASAAGSPAGRRSTRQASFGRTPVRVGSALRQCSAAKAQRAPRGTTAPHATPVSAAAGALFRAVLAAGAPVSCAPLAPLPPLVGAPLSLRFGDVSASPARAGDVTPARADAASPAAADIPCDLASDAALRRAVSTIEVLADDDDDAAAAPAGLVLPFQLMPSPFHDTREDSNGPEGRDAATPATPLALSWGSSAGGMASPSAGAVLPHMGPRLSEEEAQELCAAAGSAGLLFASPGASRPGARGGVHGTPGGVGAGDASQHHTPSAPITAAQILQGPTPDGLRYTPLAHSLGGLHISATPAGGDSSAQPATVPRPRGGSSSSIGAPAVQRLPPCSPVEDDVVVDAEAHSLRSASRDSASSLAASAADTGVDGLTLLALGSTPPVCPRERAQGRSHDSSQGQRTPPLPLSKDAWLLGGGSSSHPSALVLGAAAPDAAAGDNRSSASPALALVGINLFAQAAAAASAHGTPPSIRSLLHMATAPVESGAAADPSPDAEATPATPPRLHSGSGGGCDSEEGDEADPSPVQSARQHGEEDDGHSPSSL